MMILKESLAFLSLSGSTVVSCLSIKTSNVNQYTCIPINEAVSIQEKTIPNNNTADVTEVFLGHV